MTNDFGNHIASVRAERARDERIGVSVCERKSERKYASAISRADMRVHSSAYARVLNGAKRRKHVGGNGYSGESILGYGKADKVLIAVALILSVLGIVFIYSASSYSALKQSGDAFHYVKTQSVALALGVFAAFALSIADMKAVKKLTPILYVVGLVLVALPSLYTY